MSGRVVSGTRAGLGPDRTDRDTRTQATQTKITRNAGNGVASRRLTATHYLPFRSPRPSAHRPRDSHAVRCVPSGPIPSQFTTSRHLRHTALNPTESQSVVRIRSVVSLIERISVHSCCAFHSQIGATVVCEHSARPQRNLHLLLRLCCTDCIDPWLPSGRAAVDICWADAQISSALLEDSERGALQVDIRGRTVAVDLSHGLEHRRVDKQREAANLIDGHNTSCNDRGKQNSEGALATP